MRAREPLPEPSVRGLAIGTATGATGSKTSVPRLALSKPEAAEALGCSLRFFEQHVLPDLRIVRRRSLRFIPVREIERWLERESTALTEERAA